MKYAELKMMVAQAKQIGTKEAREYVHSAIYASATLKSITTEQRAELVEKLFSK